MTTLGVGRTKDRGSNFSKGKKFLFFSQSTLKILFNRNRGLCLEGKLSGWDVKVTLSSVKVKTAWLYTSTASDIL
jgi:hypothetical protein